MKTSELVILVLSILIARSLYNLLHEVGKCTEIGRDCYLTKDDIEHDQRLYVISNGGQYQLLRNEKVPRYATLNIICNEQQVETVVCQPNGKFEPPLNPIRKICTNPIKATITETTTADLPMTTYIIGYKWQNQNLELYRSCYDKAQMQLYFETHTTSRTALALPRPEATFTMDRLINSQMAASFKAENIHDKFKTLLGSSQNYIQNDKHIVVDRGHLAPSADFLFLNQKIATFKYVNLAPQYSRINRGSWHAIENWVRSNVDENSKICSGTIGVEQLLHSKTGSKVPIYLFNKNANPMPEWWFKIVKINNVRTVFLVYNSLNQPQTIPLLSICRKVKCPPSITNNQIICCDPNTFRTDLHKYC